VKLLLSTFVAGSALAVAALSGCGHVDPMKGRAADDLPPGPLSALPTTAPERAPDCIRLDVSRGATEHSAGMTYVRLKFTNPGDSACFVRGYPSLTLKNASNRQVGDSSRPYVSGGAKDLELAPAETVTADVRFPEPERFADGACATGATRLEILIPGASQREYVDDTYTACPGWSVSALHRGSS
jgi:hypothetical protein